VIICRWHKESILIYDKLLHIRANTPILGSTKSPMPGKKYRTVMLIDDNEIDNLINQKMIEAASITDHIYTHTGAKSAIEFLRNMEKLDISDKVLPDIIFLDIDMPLMDGFQFLDEFEKLHNSTKKKCKIVMLTSSINPQDFTRSKKYLNVKLYLNKPLSHDSIVQLDI
jgi:CheY-like chemotaxis protein